MTTPPVGVVGTVSNLSAAATGANSATLSFTEVTDGTGLPAKYDVRFSSSGALWGDAPPVSQGTCASPLAGTTVGATKTCTVLGLSPATDYQFELIPFRG
ncbi:MAG: fibronectin type III domain-containing protein, partial [Chloroflexota bacterium]